MSCFKGFQGIFRGLSESSAHSFHRRGRGRHAGAGTGASGDHPRPSPVTGLPVSAHGPCLAFRVPPGSSPSLHRLRRGLCPLFASLLTTMAGSDLSMPLISCIGSPLSFRGPESGSGTAWRPPGSQRRSSARAMVPGPRGIPPVPGGMAFRRISSSADMKARHPRTCGISGLMARPAPSATDASPTPSRVQAHGSR